MYRIGIDLGGTNIAVGVVDDGHAIVSRVSVPTMASRPAAEVVRDMGGAVEQALARAGASVADCRSMGVGSPGTCNSADGVVERASLCAGCWSSALAFPAVSATTPTVPLWPNR